MRELDTALNNKRGEDPKPYTLTQEALDNLQIIKNNPGLVIEHAYSLLKRATNGEIDIPDPTTPFSYLLECSAIQASSLHQAHEVTYRKQYPRLADNYTDLYNHMFDNHYIGRFATPGRCKFDIYFKKAEVFAQLANFEKNNIRQIVIPRGSTISVQDYLFTLLYDIEITQLPHGEVSVLYRTKNHDPVQVLNTNIVDWGYVTMGSEELIRISPTLLNVKLEQYNDSIIADGYRCKFKLKNRYCHCRVYQLRNGNIEEIHTTHSDLVYDASRVTAKLQYLENELLVEIPVIYHNSGLLGTQVFIEIYTTVGKAEEPLNEYSYDAFNYQWSKLTNNMEDIRLVRPLEFLTTPVILAKTMLYGGTNGETFLETRDRVINFAGYTKTPITPNQLETALRISGYDVLKARDTITSRSYLATRGLPINKYDNFTSGAAASMETIKTSIELLRTHPDVRDNERRITITPNLLFKTNNAGIVSPVQRIDNPLYNREKYAIEEYIGEINKLQYMFTPFYYVLDPTGDTFELRAYYMDKPNVYNQIFVDNNTSSGYSVSSDDIKIIRYNDGVKGEGYKVRLKTISATDAYRKLDPQDLFCQLAVVPIGEKKPAYVNGKLLGYEENPDTELKDYIWEFTLPTKWDMTERDGIFMHDMYMYINDPRKFELALTGEFYFVYGVKNTRVRDYQPNGVDKMICRPILDSEQIIGISVDKISYRLGWRLKNFWANGIPVQGEKQYQRYEADIPHVYSKDVYEIDENGIYIIENDDLRIKHRAGDPVLDEHGNQILRARKGDVKLDNEGKPIPILDREMIMLIDILMVDGVYYFATDVNDVKYRNSIGNIVKDWVVGDLHDIHSRLLENTLLYFYPKRTMGDATLIVDGGLEIKEPMRMSFSVTYYMDEAHYANNDIRKALIIKTHEIINKQLENITVTTSDMITALTHMGGEDIVAVHVDRFGSMDDRKFTAYTSKDASVRCSVKRIVNLEADNSIKVVEDIDVNFIKHENIEELKPHY